MKSCVILGIKACVMCILNRRPQWRDAYFHTPSPCRRLGRLGVWEQKGRKRGLAGPVTSSKSGQACATAIPDPVLQSCVLEFPGWPLGLSMECGSRMFVQVSMIEFAASQMRKRALDREHRKAALARKMVTRNPRQWNWPKPRMPFFAEIWLMRSFRRRVRAKPLPSTRLALSCRAMGSASISTLSLTASESGGFRLTMASCKRPSSMRPVVGQRAV